MARLEPQQEDEAAVIIPFPYRYLNDNKPFVLGH